MADDKDNKKDLTGILEVAKKMPANELPAGNFMTDVSIEKIDAFESLDDYASAHPESIANLDEPAATVPPAVPQDPVIPEFQSGGSSGTTDPAFSITVPAEGDGGFDLGFNSGGTGGTDPSFSSIPGLGISEFAMDLGTSAEPEPVAIEPIRIEPIAAPPAAPPPVVAAPAPAPPKPPKPTPPPPASMGEVRIQQPPVSTASVPFSILIEGDLTDSEKEKLLDVISRENIGIREIDLEPQLAAGRILIPRISEYAAILIIQKLRGIRASMKLGPADQIYSSKNKTAAGEITKEMEGAPTGASARSFTYISADGLTPAENIPITAESLSLAPGTYERIDVVTASAALHSRSLEVESSTEYENLVEALKRELKYKAFRKGANAIFYFKLQIELVSSPTSYRLTAIGSAIRFPAKSLSHSEDAPHRG